MCVEELCEQVERKLKGGLRLVMVLWVLDGAGGPIHGYRITREIEERTGGYVSIGTGTVYTLLHTLEEQGLVRHRSQGSERGPERKVYRLTEEGRELVGRFEGVMERFSEAVEGVRGSG